ncbi:MAG: MFS transporter [Candidatus Gracilibacteria bacterium]
METTQPTQENNPNVVINPTQPEEIVEQNREQGFSIVRATQPDDEIRIKNMLNTNVFMGFVWMLFHFTVVYFFTITLKEPLLVGAFLAIGNAISLVLDIPMGILQRHFSARKLFLFGGISQLLAGLIFLKLIFATTIVARDVPIVGSVILENLPVGTQIFSSILDFFLNDVGNIILLIIASLFYGFTKEVNDVTSYAYIMNSVDPNKYASVLSKMNIYFGAGSLFGLLLSGFVLGFEPFIAVMIVNIFIVLYLLFLGKYFDRSDVTLNAETIKSLSVTVQSFDAKNAVKHVTGVVSMADFNKVASSAKTLFFRPVGPQVAHNPLSIKSLYEDTKKELERVKLTIIDLPRNYFLIWSFIIIMLFGAWDTFASSFLLDYLAKFAPNFHYILLACIAIPAYLAQGMFIKLAGKFGVFFVISLGLVLAIGSMFGFVFMMPDANTLNVAEQSVTDVAMNVTTALPWQAIGMLIAFGMVNSLGYAAAMSLSQEGFLTSYNTTYASKLNLTEIDANASSAPMKIVQNLANVFGLILGGVLLTLLGHVGFFALFGVLLVCAFGLTMKWRKSLLFE